MFLGWFSIDFHSRFHRTKMEDGGGRRFSSELENVEALPQAIDTVWIRDRLLVGVEHKKLRVTELEGVVVFWIRQ